ncbi:hypothetical protein RBS60_16025 [Sinomonas sp. ASV486]|uniref:hypothetical protein n=1 Tax=Sinomonas sp. ASV486 TaxID=3051170 RepID=UPI0027DD1075|nr:hypothetical protein [Sinomonas sp. ASV486]MDQ4491710.1 hypothetical protein [Sinomonas sp. ASV486]
MHQTSPALRRIAVAWLLALVLAIVASVLAITAVKNAVAGPADPVRAYIGALQAGDGGRALGLLHTTVPSGSPALLDGAPLKDSMSRIRDISYGTAKADGDHATVAVRFTVEGEAHESQFAVDRTGTDWLFFPRWSISPTSLPALTATVVNSTRATMNGMSVNMPEGRNAFPVFFPGSYVGSLDGAQFAAEPRAVVVSGPGATAPLNLATKATPQLLGAIEAKLHSYLDDCARTATQQQRLQPNCPFSLATNTRIQDGTIAWSVSAYPTVSVEPFQGSWTIAPLAGKAELKAVAIDLFTGAKSPVDTKVDFSFNARLDVSDAAITVTPQLK